ncbi:MAG: PIN domain-containing protein [Thermoplasmata archaeon]|nr:PIN domain-containing protein [Thermoplasmata archaeon]
MDSWAWLALANKKDKYHEVAKEIYNKIKTKEYVMVTSDYVIDEVVTALFRNVTIDKAIRFIEAIFEAAKNNLLKIERITRERFEGAWMLRKKLHDKPFISFTDLTSFILMKELSIKKVFTGDTDFEKVNMGFQLLK